MDQFCYYGIRDFAERLVNRLHDAQDLEPAEICTLEVYPGLLVVVARIMELIDERLDHDLGSQYFQWQMMQQESKLLDLMHDLDRKRMMEMVNDEAA